MACADGTSHFSFPAGEIQAELDAGGEAAFFAPDAGGECAAGFLNEAKLAKDVAFRIEAVTLRASRNGSGNGVCHDVVRMALGYECIEQFSHSADHSHIP